MNGPNNPDSSDDFTPCGEGEGEACAYDPHNPRPQHERHQPFTWQMKAGNPHRHVNQEHHQMS